MTHSMMLVVSLFCQQVLFERGGVFIHTNQGEAEDVLLGGRLQLVRKVGILEIVDFINKQRKSVLSSPRYWYKHFRQY